MNLKIIAACGAGMGTSMIIRLKLDKITKKLGIDAEVESMSMGQARSMINMVDIIMTSTHLASEFDPTQKAKIIGVKNLMDEEEIEAALKEAIKDF